LGIRSGVEASANINPVPKMLSATKLSSGSGKMRQAVSGAGQKQQDVALSRFMHHAPR
jgi:hypothetical protein